MRELLRRKLADALPAPLPGFTRRDIRVPTGCWSSQAERPRHAKRKTGTVAAILKKAGITVEEAAANL